MCKQDWVLGDQDWLSCGFRLDSWNPRMYAAGPTLGAEQILLKVKGSGFSVKTPYSPRIESQNVLMMWSPWV